MNIGDCVWCIFVCSVQCHHHHQRIYSRYCQWLNIQHVGTRMLVNALTDNKTSTPTWHFFAFGMQHQLDRDGNAHQTRITFYLFYESGVSTGIFKIILFLDKTQKNHVNSVVQWQFKFFTVTLWFEWMIFQLYFSSPRRFSVREVCSEYSLFAILVLSFLVLLHEN